MMTTRKKSVSLGFMTHSSRRSFAQEMGPMLIESCPVRFYLANQEASKPRHPGDLPRDRPGRYGH